jgi:hypothetical protein
MQPETLPAVSVMAVNRERFREVYQRLLAEAVAKSPSAYHYGPSAVPEVARRLVDALSRGAASLSPTIKQSCRELGIEPNGAAIRAFLNATE